MATKDALLDEIQTIKEFVEGLTENQEVLASTLVEAIEDRNHQLVQRTLEMLGELEELSTKYLNLLDIKEAFLRDVEEHLAKKGGKA